VPWRGEKTKGSDGTAVKRGFFGWCGGRKVGGRRGAFVGGELPALEEGNQVNPEKKTKSNPRNINERKTRYTSKSQERRA